MSAQPVVLLPGMDGTGLLFRTFVEQTPAGFRPIVIPLPELGAYDQLVDAIAPRLPASGSFAIVAESFSGPLAVQLAARFGARISALVLCNTFLAPPLPPLLRLLPWSLLLSLPPSPMVIRRLLLGDTASGIGRADSIRVVRGRDGKHSCARRSDSRSAWSGRRARGALRDREIAQRNFEPRDARDCGAASAAADQAAGGVARDRAIPL